MPGSVGRLHLIWHFLCSHLLGSVISATSVPDAFEEGRPPLLDNLYTSDLKSLD